MRRRDTTPGPLSTLACSGVALLFTLVTLAVNDGAVEAQSSGAAPQGGAARQGLRVRFASIDGQSGMEGSAFLLFSSRRISLDAAPTTPCAGAHVVRAEARIPRGYIQVVELTLHLRSGGDVPIRAEGCPRAELRAQLEDGTWLEGGEGSVSVSTPTLASGALVSGTYSWTATRGNAPFPMRGEFNLTLP